MRPLRAFAWSLACCLIGSSVQAQGLGRDFTYQGRLTENGVPASGAYDMEMKLFDAPTGGTQVGAMLLENVQVAAGLFSVRLNFSDAFAGEARYLEIAVRPGASTGAFTTLADRQALTPVPNALYSAATSWAGISGVPTGFADGVDADSGGDITEINTPPNSGLTGGTAAGAADLWVDFGGSGSAGKVSRIDHHHLGQSWSGGVNPGLAITSAGLNGTVLSGAATNASGLTYGVRGSSTSSNGVGVFGEVTSSSGPTYAVLGHTHSTSGTALYGIAIGTTGTTFGVQGLSDSSGGQGVFGHALSGTGSTFGVHGQSNSTSGRGVFGHASATSGATHGVFGQTASGGGLFVTSGVTGHATHPTGVTFGVRGISDASNGVGVYGSATSNAGSAVGVWGKTESLGGVGVVAEAPGGNSASTALEVKNGRIRITGAGFGTQTAAFKIAAGTSECGSGAFTVIDHPHTNFNPDAIIFVTPQWVVQSVAVLYWPGGGTCPGGRWLIWQAASADYNVLAFVP